MKAIIFMAKFMVLNKIAFKVKKAAERSILQGHPWVFETSITKQNKEGSAGDVAVVFDQRRNQCMAIGLYDPDSPIRIKILHKGGSAGIDASFFERKLDAAYQIRGPLLQSVTTAYRLCYGENDGMPGLIIDIYGRVAVIKLYSGIWVPYLGMLGAILQHKYKIATGVLRLNRILQGHVKKDVEIRDGAIIFGALEGEEVEFLEHGLPFKANVLKGHKTGYFLDHRHNRLKVRGLAAGKKVLDVFSYAGGFSVNALAGGAKRVISLDISAQALELAKENAARISAVGTHETMAMDAFEGLELLKKKGETFGLIIVDPPSFAKKADEVAGALNSYRRLVNSAVGLVEPGGVLMMASCSSRITKEAFFDLVADEMRKSGREYSVLDATAHDIDHPEGIAELNYLKAIYLEVL